jgi:exodeoxyribonuclease V beta subunit
LLVSALETCRGTGAAEGFPRRPHRTWTRGAIRAQHRLEAALRSFDEAAIFTIHSFCQRTLQDRAFESGTLFDAELVPTSRRCYAKWRTIIGARTFTKGEPALVALAVLDRINPAALARLLGNTVQHPTLKVLPGGDQLGDARANLLALFQDLRSGWAGWREEVHHALVVESAWAKGDFAKPT